MTGGARGGTDSWYRTPRPNPDATVRLYAFPHAGGNAAAFQSWTRALPPSVELRAVQLPGRHDRAAEQPYTEADPLAEELLAALRPELADRPFAFFGHSMGAMLAFRLAQSLALAGAPQPVLIGVSGWAPDAPGRQPMPSADLPSEEFIEAVEALGGLPAEVLSSPELVRLILPTLRADFRVCAGFRPLDLPRIGSAIVSYTGDADPLVAPGDMANWRHRTRDFLGSHVYRGDHFYLGEHGPAVLADFVRRLRDRLRQGAHAVPAGRGSLPLPAR